MYGSDEFGQAVPDVLAVAGKIGPGLTPHERMLVRRHFRTTSRYEWMNWDMGSRK